MRTRDIPPGPASFPASPPVILPPGHPTPRRRGRVVDLAAGLVLGLAAFAMGLAGLALGLAGLARAGAPIAVEARLHTPPDSHEPQRALVEIRNAGPDDLARITVACTFLGDGGGALERGTAVAGPIGAGATARAEVIYFGWPRARRVACERAEPESPA